MIILASQSPRRELLLKKIIKDFKIIPANVNEINYPLDELSKVKAKEIAKDHPDDYIIAADTIVFFKDQIFGKPQSEDEAYFMLNSLSNNVHTVKTIYTIMNQNKGIEITKSVYSDVYFNDLSNNTILEYIKTKSPMDKAGAYGLQDNDRFHLIKKIDGSVSNVIGLPLEELTLDLKSLNII